MHCLDCTHAFCDICEKRLEMCLLYDTDDGRCLCYKCLRDEEEQEERQLEIS